MTSTVIILLEVQNSEIRLWVGPELLKTWRAKHTGIAGAPMVFANVIEAAFLAVNVPCEIEFGDGFEEFKNP
jgi:hypothetical protein